MCGGKTFECRYMGNHIKITVSTTTMQDRATVGQRKANGTAMRVNAGAPVLPPPCENIFVGDTAALRRQLPGGGDADELANFEDGKLCEFSMKATITGRESTALPIEIGFIQHVTRSKRVATYTPGEPQNFSNFEISRTPLDAGASLLDCGENGPYPWFQGKFALLDAQAEECALTAFDNPKWEVPTFLDLVDDGGPYGYLASVVSENSFATCVAVSCKAAGTTKFVPLLQTSWSSSMKVDNIRLQGQHHDARVMADTSIAARVSSSDWEQAASGTEWEFGKNPETANIKLVDSVNYFDVRAGIAELDALDDLIS